MIFSFLRAAVIRSTAARPVLGDPLCRRRPGFVSIRRAPPHPAATWKRRKNRSARRVCPRILRPARKRQGCERRPSPCLPRGVGRRAGTQLGPFSNRACRRARGGGGSGFSVTIAPRAGRAKRLRKQGSGEVSMRHARGQGRKTEGAGRAFPSSMRRARGQGDAHRRYPRF